MLGAATLMMFGTTACATKKYVRQTVTPVEGRVSTVEKKSSDNASAIGEMENNLSRTDEKATEANRNAQAAGQAADRANQAAVEARTRADSAASAAEQASSRLGNIVNNIDNYQLVTTEAVLFPFNKATLTKDAKAQLDQAVSQIQNNKNFILEVEGFTDKSGSHQVNLALAQRRADAVVRYLTVEHNVPLRKIHMLGVGAENFSADNHTREGRKQNRRVELKVYALNLEGQGGQNSAMSGQSSTGTQGSMNQGSTTRSSDYTTGSRYTGSNTNSNYTTGRTTATGTTGTTSPDQMRSRTEQTTGQTTTGQSTTNPR